MHTYPILGLLAAAAVTVFALYPLGVIGVLALYALGFLAFSQAVWNTSRVPRLAEQAYQARIQSITTMAFTLGTPLGALWGSIAVDHFGLSALTVGAGILAFISLVTIVFGKHLEDFP